MTAVAAFGSADVFFSCGVNGVEGRFAPVRFGPSGTGNGAEVGEPTAPSPSIVSNAMPGCTSVSPSVPSTTSPVANPTPPTTSGRIQYSRDDMLRLNTYAYDPQTSQAIMEALRSHQIEKGNYSLSKMKPMRFTPPTSLQSSGPFTSQAASFFPSSQPSSHSSSLSSSFSSLNMSGGVSRSQAARSLLPQFVNENQAPPNYHSQQKPPSSPSLELPAIPPSAATAKSYSPTYVPVNSRLVLSAPQVKSNRSPLVPIQMNQPAKKPNNTSPYPINNIASNPKNFVSPTKLDKVPKPATSVISPAKPPVPVPTFTLNTPAKDSTSPRPKPSNPSPAPPTSAAPPTTPTAVIPTTPSAKTTSPSKSDESPAQSSPSSEAVPTVETDIHRLQQRQKQIDYGYKTLGYIRYRLKVPKEERTEDQPKTPCKTQACPKRTWDSQVKKWRRDLHLWDPTDPDECLPYFEDELLNRLFGGLLEPSSIRKQLDEQLGELRRTGMIPLSPAYPSSEARQKHLSSPISPISPANSTSRLPNTPLDECENQDAADSHKKNIIRTLVFPQEN